MHTSSWLMSLLLGLSLVSCSNLPAQQNNTHKSSTGKVNPISRLPPQTKAVPALADMPQFGSDAFNRIKDVAPDSPPDVSQVPDAVPAVEPASAYGNKTPYLVLGETYTVMETAKGFTQTGKASWYGKKFHGLKTSSGEKYDMYKMTAAHTSLPLPSYVRVTNLANNKSVIVKVNDRGPFHSERIMDLSYAAAARLDYLKTGTANVRIDAINPEEFQAAPANPEKTETVAAVAAPNTAAITDTAVSANNAVTNNPEPKLYLQVGAFSARGNASALQAKLANLINAPIIVTRDENNSNGISRVRIGPFASLEEAEKASAIITDNSFGKAILLKR